MRRNPISHVCTGAIVLLVCLLGVSVFAGSAYTNHAGEAISGRVVSLGKKQVTLEADGQQARYPLSIFLPSERRRLACDAGQPEMPPSLAPVFRSYRQVTGRCRARLEANLISKEECDRQCALARDVLLTALRKAVAEHTLTEQERAILSLQ